MNDIGNIFYATLVGLPPVITAHYSYMKHQIQVTGRQNTDFLKSSKNDLMSLMVRVMSQAEAFFNKSLLLYSVALFARRKIVTSIEDYRSPKSLNHAAGWLVPLHTDGCSLNLNSWDCEPNTSHEFIQHYKGKHVSIVIFLNELSEDGGGEFVFVDPIKEERPYSNIPDEVTDIDFETGEEEKDRQRNLRKWAHENKKQQYRLSAANVPPPSRDQIRRSLSQSSSRKHHTAGVTKSVSVVAK